METPKVGQIVLGEAKKDAIHVAIAPVQVSVKVYPGQHVGFAPGGTVIGPGGKAIGIIDPFLTSPVEPFQTCWLFLYPNTVTSLRHDWEHPAFVEPEEEENETWDDEYGCAC